MNVRQLRSRIRDLPDDYAVVLLFEEFANERGVERRRNIVSMVPVERDGVLYLSPMENPSVQPDVRREDNRPAPPSDSPLSRGIRREHEQRRAQRADVDVIGANMYYNDPPDVPAAEVEPVSVEDSEREDETDEGPVNLLDAPPETGLTATAFSSETFAVAGSSGVFRNFPASSMFQFHHYPNPFTSSDFLGEHRTYRIDGATTLPPPEPQSLPAGVLGNMVDRIVRNMHRPAAMSLPAEALLETETPDAETNNDL